MITKDQKMKANRSDQHEIFAKDACHYHVLLKKRNFSPDMRSYTDREIIQIFSDEEFKANEAMQYSAHGSNWITVSGFDTGYVIHNPELISAELRQECQDYWNTVFKRKPKDPDSPEALKARVRKLENLLKYR